MPVGAIAVGAAVVAASALALLALRRRSPKVKPHDTPLDPYLERKER